MANVHMVNVKSVEDERKLEELKRLEKEKHENNYLGSSFAILRDEYAELEKVFKKKKETAEKASKQYFKNVKDMQDEASAMIEELGMHKIN